MICSLYLPSQSAFARKEYQKGELFPLFLPRRSIRLKKQNKAVYVHIIRSCPNLCGGDGLAGTDGALAGGEALTASNLVGLLDDLLTLGQDELDVAGVGHVGVDLLND